MFIVLFFLSCSPSIKIYDKSVPEDNMATLVLDFGYTVTSFDGKVVKWKSGTRIAYMKVPAGEYYIGFQYKDQANSTSPIPGKSAIKILSYKDSRRVSFVPGATYSVRNFDSKSHLQNQMPAKDTRFSPF